MVTQQKKKATSKATNKATNELTEVLPFILKVIYGFHSEKGGCGKSYVTKAFVQYVIDRGYPFTLVEADRSNPDVQKVFPDIVKHAIFTEDPAQVYKADVIFEYALENPVILSLPSQVHRAMSFWIEHSNVLKVFKEYDITYYNLFVTNGRYDSIKLLTQSLEYYQDRVSHVIVRNWGLGTYWSSFESDERLQELIKKYKVKTIDFPKLDDREAHLIDKLCINFGDATNHKDLTVFERQRVKNFLDKAYAAFDSAELWHGDK